MTSTDHPALAALRQQVDCYRRLAKLAELQRVHVRQGQTEQLLEVLAARQAVLEQLMLFERAVGPQRKRWAEFLAELAPAARAAAEAQLAEARGLLEQITTADRNDALVLRQRKLNPGPSIHEDSHARPVNRNYAASAYGSLPGRVDVQS